MSYDTERSITVMRDLNKPNQVLIGSSDSTGDPWEDIALLIEGVGVLVATCADNGKVSHNDQSVEDYLKDYIGKVCNDYKTVRTLN